MSLRDREEGCRIYFPMTITPRLNSPESLHDEGNSPFIAMKETRLSRKELGNEKALKSRVRRESPRARRKECCHICLSKTISLSHSGLMYGCSFARLCLRDFSFDHFDDEGGRLVGERKPLRFDDERGQGLGLIA